MPNILITGNGFDLYHGLPTSYCDFINILDYSITNKTVDSYKEYKFFFEFIIKIITI